MIGNKDIGIEVVPMDSNTQEFKDFQLLIKAKVQNASLADKISIKMIGLKFIMEDYLEGKDELIHVGSFLKKALKLLDVKHKDFAKYIDLKAPNLSKMLKGERKINMEQALIFENLFMIDAEIWIGIQSKNELFKLEKKNRNRFKKYRINDLVYIG